MKKITKKLRMWYDKRTDKIIGYNSLIHCQGCMIRKSQKAPMDACPPQVQSIIANDLDQELPMPVNKPEHIIAVNATVILEVE